MIKNRLQSIPASFARHKKAVIAVCAIVLAVFAGVLISWDRTPPTLTASDQTVTYGTTLSVQDLATGSDNRSESVALSIKEVSPTGATISADKSEILFDNVGDYNVTVIGRDTYQNEAEIDTLVRVKDETPPSFTDIADHVEVGYGVAIECVRVSGVKNTIYVNAEDEITDTTMAISAVTPKTKGLSSDSYEINNGTALFHKLGNYDVEITASDEYRNRATQTVTVAVTDQTAPTFKGLKKSYVLSESDQAPDYLTGVTAKDEIDGDLTAQISFNDAQVTYGVPGKYTMQYSVSDHAGNSVSKKIPVTIQDTTPPAITLAQTSYSLTVGDSAPAYRDDISAVDEQDGTITDRVKIDDSHVDYETPGTYSVSFTVKDSAGNKTTRKAAVTVSAQDTSSGFYGEDDSSTVSTASQEIVLVTPTGECYHTHKCGRGTYYESTLQNAKNRGLRPCKKCYG